MIGGESDSLIFNSMEMLDPGTDEWQDMAGMTVPRCGLGVCVLDGAIYALGGWVGIEIGATVERYDPGENYWREWGRLTTLRFAMGVTGHKGEWLWDDLIIYDLVSVTRCRYSLAKTFSIFP